MGDVVGVLERHRDAPAGAEAGLVVAQVALVDRQEEAGVREVDAAAALLHLLGEHVEALRLAVEDDVDEAEAAGVHLSRVCAAIGERRGRPQRAAVAVAGEQHPLVVLA